MRHLALFSTYSGNTFLLCFVRLNNIVCFLLYVTHQSIVLVFKFPQNMALTLENAKRSRSPAQSHSFVCVPWNSLPALLSIPFLLLHCYSDHTCRMFQMFSPRDCEHLWVRGKLCAIASEKHSRTHVKDSWTTFHSAKSLTCNQDTMGIVRLCAVWRLYLHDYAFPSWSGQEAVTMANKFRAPINEKELAEPREGREDMVNVFIGIVCIPHWCTSTHT